MPTVISSVVSSFIRRPYLTLALFLTSLLLISSYHRPTPTAPGFIFPGLLPSTFKDLLDTSPNVVYPSPHLRREQERRYAHLRQPVIPGSTRLKDRHAKYLFVTLTRNIEAQLPDLLNTIVMLVSFLGPDRVRFSIYEGPSSDSTPTVLRTTLVPMLRRLGVPDSEVVVETDRPQVDFNQKNRIEALAELRNEALAPLWTKEGWGESTAAVVYFNDVYLRAGDVLELLHQHLRAGEAVGKETGVTSGIDWWKRHPEYYYDVWVARTVSPPGPCIDVRP
jgi:alpha-1,3-mannosyltransferase